MASNLEATLDLIVAKATALREAGVTCFQVGDVRVELAAKDPPAPSTTAASEEREPIANPIEDPDTYGGEIPRRRGEPVPVEDDDHGERRRKR